MLCNAYPTIFHLAGPGPAPRPWHFDAGSALIGAVVALLLAGLAYRNRDALRAGWAGVTAPLARWGDRVRSSTEDRYRDVVAAWAQSTVVLAGAASLDHLFIEPKLLPPTPLPQSLSEVDSAHTSAWAMPLRRIMGGHSRLLILGSPGAGRTTLLASVALAHARAGRAGGGDATAATTLEPPEPRLPLVVSLAATRWTGADEQEAQPTPMDRLLNAAIAAVGATGGLIPTLRQRLEAGEAIVLIDGWDELAPEQRGQAAAWLAQLVDALPENLWVVTAGPRGYGSLTEAGFVPLQLAAWDAAQVETFAQQWMEIFPPASELAPVALRRLVAELRQAARAGDPPLDLALRALVWQEDGEVPLKRSALFDRALDCLLGQEDEPELSEDCRAVLEQVALSLQQEGRATASREEIQQAIESVLPLPEERPARAVALVFRALTGPRGVLRRVGTDRFTLAHPLWQAYLAAQQLTAEEPSSLVERLDDPRWAEVLHFYAGDGDMGPLVTEWLRHPDDMFYTGMQRLSPWIRSAPADAAWCNGAMAVLARNVLQPGLLAPVRQALADALAETGASGLNYFFTQATQHADADIRAAGAWGLTRTAGEPDLPAVEAILQDESAAVREAGVRGLARMGIDAATRWLGAILVAGDDVLSPIAAEALAQCGEEGVAFLHEAAESDDVMARRAAVLGLAQIEKREMLEEIAREDEQWIVRSAAAAALEELEERETASGVAPPPDVERLPWLISWAASQGEGVGVGEAARHTLRRALGEGNTPVRMAAAQVLIQVGRPDDVAALRAALADTDAMVAKSAIEALAEINQRYDLGIGQA